MVKCSTGMLYGTRFEPLPAADELQKERNLLGQCYVLGLWFCGNTEVNLRL